MNEFDTSQIPWREPWQPDDHGASTEAELRRELCSEHVLFGRTVRAIGFRLDCDDFLFYLGDTPPRFAVVHLTWGFEARPEWPATKFFDTLDDWIQQRMNQDAEGYTL